MSVSRKLRSAVLSKWPDAKIVVVNNPTVKRAKQPSNEYRLAFIEMARSMGGGLTYMPGQTLYVAYPNEVVRVEYVRAGSDDTVNYKVKPIERDSHVVRSALGQWTTGSSLLFKDPLAAAAKSAQLAQQLIDEDR